MVWRPDPDSPRGLTLFGLAIEGTGGRQTEDYELEFGAVETGLFESRPYDTIDFAVTTQHFSSLGTPSVRAARLAQGLGTADIATQETFLELELRHPGQPGDPPHAEPAIRHRSRPAPRAVPREAHPGHLRDRRQAVGRLLHPGGPRRGPRKPLRASGARATRSRPVRPATPASANRPAPRGRPPGWPGSAAPRRRSAATGAGARGGGGTSIRARRPAGRGAPGGCGPC